MPIEHKKSLGIYHWDTFDNETFLVHESDNLADANEWIQAHYGSRIQGHGADQLDVVDSKGNIVQKFKVC